VILDEERLSLTFKEGDLSDYELEKRGGLLTAVWVHSLKSRGVEK
jgi:hypothetical protein